MKNQDIINDIKESGFDLKKIHDVNAKIAFYHLQDNENDNNPYIGVRIFLPKLIKDQIEKYQREKNCSMLEEEDRDTGDYERIQFYDDGSAVIDTGYLVFVTKER